jgi:hypothetical protein
MILVCSTANCRDCDASTGCDASIPNGVNICNLNQNVCKQCITANILTRGDKTCPLKCPNGQAKDLTKSNNDAQYCLGLFFFLLFIIFLNFKNHFIKITKVCHETCYRCEESIESADWVGHETKCTDCNRLITGKNLYNFFTAGVLADPTAS